MRDGISQGERAAPTAAKDVHLAVDTQLAPQPQHVADKMLGRIVGKGCHGVIVARARRTLAAAALIEKNDPVSIRIEKASERLVTARARPSMHDHDRLTISRAVFFPVNLVLWLLLDSQMARFVAARVRVSVCIHMVCHDGSKGIGSSTCTEMILYGETARHVCGTAGHHRADDLTSPQFCRGWLRTSGLARHPMSPPAGLAAGRLRARSAQATPTNPSDPR